MSRFTFLKCVMAAGQNRWHLLRGVQPLKGRLLWRLAVSLKRYPDTKPALMELGRPAGFFGNCARGAQRGEPIGIQRIQSRQPPSCVRVDSRERLSLRGRARASVATRIENRRLGIRCHDGQRMRQRVPLNLPSGAPHGCRRNCAHSKQCQNLIRSMNPPGMPD